MSRIFICIIGSFELPCYVDMIRMRKLQLKKYKIPHIFLFDGSIPNTYILDPNDRWYEKEVPPWPVENELNTRTNALNPHMILKFLKGVREFDETQYDYIIRVNLSTFINFPKLQKMLDVSKRHHYAGGHCMKFRISDWRPNSYDEFEFISGACMIFSSDVITFFKSFPFTSYILYEHNDDIVLSYLAKLYVNTFNHINMVFLEGGINYDSIENVIYRIKHINRDDDIYVWKKLLKSCDDLVA